MFTGIVESIGVIAQIKNEGTNKHFTINSPITQELKVDQSIAHNGVCLTVVAIEGTAYTVTAIKETLEKSNLGLFKPGDKVNLERSLTIDKRLDGHMVQGHVDTTAECIHILEENGSWLFTFTVSADFNNLMVEKGSICINGTSLTIFNIRENKFSVAIIPYTYEHTTFHTLTTGSIVNIEFDMMGKYIIKYLSNLRLSTH